jgi:ParB-like chromosome segregation protein Spo0J
MTAKLAARRRTMAIEDLTPYPGNARVHDLEAIKASLDYHGQYRPIVVQESSRRILAGNGTWQAARELDWKQIRVELIDVDDDQAQRIVLVDNRANDLAGYDDELLAGLLAPLDGLDGTGYTDEDLAQLIAEDGDLEDPPAPEPPAKPKTKPGDLYELGDHRLLCGDATSATDVARLLGGGHG